MRGAGGSRRERHGAAGAGARLREGAEPGGREGNGAGGGGNGRLGLVPGSRCRCLRAPALPTVRRTGLRRGGPHPGAVPSAGRYRVRRAAELPAGQQALRQVGCALRGGAGGPLSPPTTPHPLLPGPAPLPAPTGGSPDVRNQRLTRAPAPPTPPHPPPRPLPLQVHWALLHNHAALLVFPGLLRSGSVLPGPHRDRRGETADAGRTGDLVVCGSDSPHHRRADAQRRQ